jgi:hypothetical protein
VSLEDQAFMRLAFFFFIERFERYTPIFFAKQWNCLYARFTHTPPSSAPIKPARGSRLKSLASSASGPR